MGRHPAKGALVVFVGAMVYSERGSLRHDLHRKESSVETPCPELRDFH
jgi:hypothetical protein